MKNSHLKPEMTSTSSSSVPITKTTRTAAYTITSTLSLDDMTTTIATTKIENATKGLPSRYFNYLFHRVLPAKETIKEYVTEHLPQQYQVCLSAFDTIIKRAFEILETSNKVEETIIAID